MSSKIRLQRVKRGWMDLEVQRIHQENHNSRTIFLVDLSEKKRVFDFVAGQYLTFRFDNLAEKPLVRSYTLSSSPCQEDAIAFTVKEIDGGVVSRYLIRELKVGDVLRARGAMGAFCYSEERDEKELVLIGAGSGVTPFASMFREYSGRLGQSVPLEGMRLLLSFRSRKDLILWETFSKYKNHPGISVWTTLSQDPYAPSSFLKGRISPKMLKDCLKGNYLNKTFMICGPDEMMKVMSDFLRHSGVSEKNIRMESFLS